MRVRDVQDTVVRIRQELCTEEDWARRIHLLCSKLPFDCWAWNRVNSCTQTITEHHSCSDQRRILIMLLDHTRLITRSLEKISRAMKFHFICFKKKLLELTGTALSGLRFYTQQMSDYWGLWRLIVGCLFLLESPPGRLQLVGMHFRLCNENPFHLSRKTKINLAQATKCRCS